jgi:hypothetical protein
VPRVWRASRRKPNTVQLAQLKSESPVMMNLA